MRDGVDHLVDFPVLHINIKQTGKPTVFQVETGPVLLPAALIDDPALTQGGFALAYVFFNRLDRVDLAIWGPAGAAGMSRVLLKLAKRSLPSMILRDFELLIKIPIVQSV
jgi:hypothetical protein